MRYLFLPFAAEVDPYTNDVPELVGPEEEPGAYWGK
jgi:hypothetical protein